MMNRPPVMELAKKAGSRYQLVTLSMAVEEMYEDKLIVIPAKEA